MNVSDSDSGGSRSDPELAAQEATPWIGVHVLAEFIFCPRAGLIAFEQRRIDPGEEIDGAPRLDYLPDFEIELIEAALQKIWSGIWALLTWTWPVVLVTFIAGLLFDRRLWLILIPLAVWGARKLFVGLKNVVILSGRLRAARQAAPREPDPASMQSQVVNWWSLLKAGFTPVEYQDAHEDTFWHVAGKPWRVLHKGTTRIPVFRKRLGKPQIYPQHIGRMLAYCHVIEKTEGASAPYGIVLFGDGYEGVTIPTSDENRATFHQGLLNARRLVQAVQTGGLIPGMPSRSTVCHDCHLGRPRVYRAGITDSELNGQKLSAYLTRGEDRRTYHSICGDRFGWVPPHDLATRRGLR